MLIIDRLHFLAVKCWFFDAVDVQNSCIFLHTQIFSSVFFKNLIFNICNIQQEASNFWRIYGTILLWQIWTVEWKPVLYTFLVVSTILFSVKNDRISILEFVRKQQSFLLPTSFSLSFFNVTVIVKFLQNSINALYRLASKIFSNLSRPIIYRFQFHSILLQEFGDSQSPL